MNKKKIDKMIIDIIVYKRAMVMKPGKHQRRKQRCQNLDWKVHDRAKSFVLRSYTMHEFLKQYRSKPLLCFVHGQDEKSKQKPTTKNFGGFHNHSPLLTLSTSSSKNHLCYYSTPGQDGTKCEP